MRMVGRLERQRLARQQEERGGPQFGTRHRRSDRNVCFRTAVRTFINSGPLSRNTGRPRNQIVRVAGPASGTKVVGRIR